MRPRTILLIDDEDDIREVATLTLETMGDFEVTSASSGEAGIECATREQPDAILLDVMMPELDGPSTLARLRAIAVTRDIPVIFLTAKVQAVDRRRLADLGAVGIIAKPFDPMTLAEEVTSLLQEALVST
jgi:CheY-like chemotaxis protein